MQGLKTAMGQAALSARIRKMLGVEEDPNLKVGINGFGKLGRLIARAIMEAEDVDLVAINDPYVDADYMAYQLLHDDVHGPCRATVEAPDRRSLLINGRPVNLLSTREPEKVDWDGGGARYVIEASGRFTTAHLARGHLKSAGVEHVIIAAPCADVPQLLAGVNSTSYKGETVVSCGSSASHCLALLCKALDEAFGLESAAVSVLQACTSHELSQVEAGPQGANDGLRSGSSGSRDIIPTCSEAVAAVRKMLPALAGRLGGLAFRVPSSPGGASVVDLTVELRSPADLGAIRAAMSAAASAEPLRGRLGFRDDDVDGADFDADGRSCIFDGRASMALSSTFVKVVAWYPREWAYARRLVEVLLHMQAIDRGQLGDEDAVGEGKRSQAG